MEKGEGVRKEKKPKSLRERKKGVLVDHNERGGFGKGKTAKRRGLRIWRFRQWRKEATQGREAW